MDDFTSKPGVAKLYGLVEGRGQCHRAGKTPLSLMSPTIVTKDGKLFLVFGSPGGARIITITLETILNVIDHGMSISEASGLGLPSQQNVGEIGPLLPRDRRLSLPRAETNARREKREAQNEGSNEAHRVNAIVALFRIARTLER